MRNIIKKLNFLVLSILGVLGTSQGRAESQLFLELGYGLTFFSNTLNNSESDSSGIKFGSIEDQKWMLSVGTSLFESSYSLASVSGLYSRIFRESFTHLFMDAAYVLTSDSVHFFVGIRPGYLMAKYDLEYSGTSPPADEIQKINRMTLGGIAGVRFKVWNNVGLGLETGFSSTIGKGTNIKRIDPKVVLSWNF